MTDIDIPAARALCAAATPEPWEIESATGYAGNYEITAAIKGEHVPNKELMAQASTLIRRFCDELEAARKDLILQEAAMQARTQAWEAEVERLQGIIMNLTAELKTGDKRQQLIARQATEAAQGES